MEKYIQILSLAQLTDASERKKRFVFAESGCSVRELILPDISISKSLLFELQKQTCPIQKISISSQIKKKKIKKFIEALQFNNTISYIKIDTRTILNETNQADVAKFLEQMTIIIPAIRNIRVIEVITYDSVNLDLFFESLKNIKYIQLQIRLVGTKMPALILNSLKVYLNNSNQTLVLTLTLDDYDGTSIEHIVDFFNETRFRSRPKLVIIQPHLTIGRWKKILNIESVSAICIRDWSLYSQTEENIWHKLSDVFAENKLIESLIIDTDMNCPNFTKLISRNKYLKKLVLKLQPQALDGSDDRTLSEFADAVCKNTTLEYLGIRSLPVKTIAYIVKNNKTLKVLSTDLMLVKFNAESYQHFWEFIDALKNNTTLTEFNISHITQTKYRTRTDVQADPFRIDLTQAFMDVLETNTTLLNISCDHYHEVIAQLALNPNLLNNRREYNRLRWNCVSFGHMIKRNASLMNQLPIELWLNIVNRLGVDGLDKMLLAPEQ